MLSMLRKTTASMAKSGRSRPAEQYDVVDDLSTWEFVNASQSDDEDLYSFDGGEVVSDEDDVMSQEPGAKSEEEDSASESRDFVPPHDVISIMQSLSVSPPMTFPVDVTRHHVYHDDDRGYDDYKDEVDDDDENDLYNDDVDDELVPWKLKDRFGKQRIRKMGKRGGPKINKSKRLPYYHNRPGCLYGKHGLGVQHSYI